MERNKKLNSDEMKITLKCLFGFEQTLCEELHELGYEQAEPLNRAVSIQGTWKDVYFLNLYCRCAISILVEIDRFYIQNEKDLYKRAMKIKWTDLFDVSKTFAVKGAVFSSLFTNTQYPYLLVKDAIVDVFREKTGDRPNIELKRPQVMIDLYIKEKEVVISLNTSGVPLFQRGYRTAVGDAPMNEVVAASLIRMSGWDRKTTLMDPFCGSGTILMEAALLASGIPSNIERQHYAFKNLKNFDQKMWDEIYDNAPRNVRHLDCTIIGSDISDEMIVKTRRNLRSMPFGRYIKTAVHPFEQTEKPEENVFILTNPPYGERMGEGIEELYSQIGTWLKHKMTGSEAWIISSNMEGFKQIGLKNGKKFKIFNGDLECSFRQYKTFEGKKVDTFAKDESSEESTSED